MATFVIIGGGEIGSKETYKIDEKIVALANKDKPNFLFIPTASNESEGYINCVKSIYGDLLKCNFDWLSLKTENIEKEVNKIAWADIIYVGGGNTSEMLKKWKEYKIDEELKKYSSTEKIYCGLSAGSICWFEYGISDSESFTNPNTWEYTTIEGLGMIKGCHSPHYDDRIKEASFIKFLSNYDHDILAIENNCALIINQNMELIKSSEDKNAFYVTNKGKDVINIEKLNKKEILR